MKRPLGCGAMPLNLNQIADFFLTVKILDTADQIAVHRAQSAAKQCLPSWSRESLNEKVWTRESGLQTQELEICFNEFLFTVSFNLGLIIGLLELEGDPSERYLLGAQKLYILHNFKRLVVNETNRNTLRLSAFRPVCLSTIIYLDDFDLEFLIPAACILNGSTNKKTALKSPGQTYSAVLKRAFSWISVLQQPFPGLSLVTI